jgi:hypothetical protein
MTENSNKSQTVLSQSASLIRLLHILADDVVSEEPCPVASMISTRHSSSTLSIAFAGVRKAWKR